MKKQNNRVGRSSMERDHSLELARLMTELDLDARVKITHEQKKLMFENMAKKAHQVGGEFCHIISQIR